MDMEDRRPYLGSLKQLFRADEYRLVGGTGDGMRMFHVHNGAEMEFVCSVDRCMDLHYLRCKGYNLGFLTGVGDVAPQYYDARPLGCPPVMRRGTGGSTGGYPTARRRRPASRCARSTTGRRSSSGV